MSLARPPAFMFSVVDDVLVEALSGSYAENVTDASDGEPKRPLHALGTSCKFCGRTHA